MIKAWGITDKGAVRHQNQDTYYLSVPTEHLALALVCDGMGGAKAGNVASKMAVDIFIGALQSWPDRLDDPGGLLRQGAEQANSAVFLRAATETECNGMGTTLVAALVKEQEAFILNIGDSRAYCIGKAGILKVTRDHSVVEDLVLRGDITPEEARTHPQKNLITRALGAEEHVRADLFQKKLEKGDVLLLCSDGLSNMMTDQELLYEVLHGGPMENCCQRLLDIALSRGSPDNVTAVLIQCV